MAKIKRDWYDHINIPFLAYREKAITETITIAAGVAGDVVDFQITWSPIADSHHEWIGGFGDTSLILTSTTFDNEVVADTEDADLVDGDYWIDYVTGRGHGKKKDNVIAMTADYYVFVKRPA